ncbi:PREDICTED: protein YIF1B-B-like isoform X2 [Priapulus caudatus]|uniref:Protein YIF1 n=1 Tax=Priapulus caudatus TaxID=37621 RepID=A0ABM1ESM0_PRICU|nr:PREDICTED: protein YIF1B-B-like isoform X2 [Priapulus caudatus]
MDPPTGTRNPKKSKQRSKRHQQPQLFDDTSMHPPAGTYGQSPGYPQTYPQGYSQGYPPQQAYMAPGTAGYPGYMPTGHPSEPAQHYGEQIFNDPMAAMAVQYGSNLAGHGKEYVAKNIDKYVPVSRLKYYFAVDNGYVGKKLALLFFPFSHMDWSIKYNQHEPVAPRYEVNAPDLYIPVMAFVTYLLVTGVVLGTQQRFSPEQLGMEASSLLVWLVIEVACLMLVLYIMNMKTDLKYLDVLAYCGYKYVGMIAVAIACMIFNNMGFYVALGWVSCSIMFFLVRTLKVQILPEAEADQLTGSKRRIYLLLLIAILQPIFIYWLTSGLFSYRPTLIGKMAASL